MNGLCLFLCVFLSTLLFVFGVGGFVFNRNSMIITMMSLELLFLSAIMNFVVFSVYRGDISGQIVALVALGVVAGEAVIGLALLLNYYRNKGDISAALMDSLE